MFSLRMISLSERIKQLYLCHKLGSDDRFILSGIFNIVAALLFIWWSFGVINSILITNTSCCIHYSRNLIDSKSYKEIIECFGEYGRNKKKTTDKNVYMSK